MMNQIMGFILIILVLVVNSIMITNGTFIDGFGWGFTNGILVISGLIMMGEK